MRRGPVGVAMAMGVLLVGCSGSSATSRNPSPTTEAEGAPAVADATMALNRVLAGLDGVVGDLQRILVKERRITTEVTDRLQAVYVGPELLNQIDAFKVDVSQGLAGYRPTPGNRLTVASRIITATRDCVFAEVRRDYSPVSTRAAQSPPKLYIVLVAKRALDDPRNYNPTAWAMLYDGVQDDGSQPENICA